MCRRRSSLALFNCSRRLDTAAIITPVAFSVPGCPGNAFPLGARNADQRGCVGDFEAYQRPAIGLDRVSGPAALAAAIGDLRELEAEVSSAGMTAAERRSLTFTLSSVMINLASDAASGSRRRRTSWLMTWASTTVPPAATRRRAAMKSSTSATLSLSR
jgi:hypothetical protein